MGLVTRIGILGVMLLSYASMAMATNAAPVNVVEVANFFCPECYKAQMHIQPLEAAIKKSGGQFDFVPIFYGKVSSWPSRVYLSVPKALQATAKKALFTSAIVNGLPMTSAQATCVAVNDLAPNYSVEHCINQANSRAPALRLQRALTLLQHIYGKKGAVLLFPVFVIEQNGRIQSVLSRQEYAHIPELLTEVVRHVQALSR